MRVRPANALDRANGPSTTLRVVHEQGAASPGHGWGVLGTPHLFIPIAFGDREET
jgi:hypothetical protein